jgi:hypothetical protein
VAAAAAALVASSAVHASDRVKSPATRASKVTRAAIASLGGKQRNAPSWAGRVGGAPAAGAVVGAPAAAALSGALITAPRAERSAALITALVEPAVFGR